MKRRDLLKSGALASATAGLSALSPSFLRRQLLAAPAERPKKMLFIFQRGGSDGLNAVIPRGDPEYNSENRPTLFVPEERGIDLGNGFAQLHPQLEPLLEIYNSSSLNGQPGPGNLAILHRIGYEGQSQSHFDGQKFWETGAPRRSTVVDGIFFRHIVETLGPTPPPLVAATLASTQMLALRGNRPLPTIENLESFLFAGGDEEVSNFVGQLPTTRASANGKGFLGLYGGPHDFPGKRYRDLVYDTGIALARTVTSSQEALSQGPYIAENGADYDFGNFGEQLQRAAMLLKRTPVRVLGINLQGWDTHVNQGAVLGAQPKLLSDLAQGLRALFLDLQEQWDDLLIVTLTEFGRTTLENASGGTDHGKACNLFVAGGAVRGGVYNCDASTWAPGDALGDNRRYLLHRTDFRAIFAEIFTRHFGDDPALLDRIIPGYSEAVAATPGEFEPLGFLPA